MATAIHVSNPRGTNKMATCFIEQTKDQCIAAAMQQMIHDYPFAQPSQRIVLAAQFNLCAKHMAARK